MKRVALFPYNSKILPIVRHFDKLQNEYVLTKIFSLPCEGLANRDVSWVCNQHLFGMKVCELSEYVSFDENEWDIFFLIREHLPVEYNLKKLIETVLSYDKEIFCFEHNYKSAPNWIKKICMEPLMKLIASNYNISEVEGEYKPIKTPVLLVGGLFEQADVLDVALSVTSVLRSRGLSVATLTKESSAQIFNFYDFSSFYIETNSIPDKILRINETIRSIEREYFPDIIVVEAPDSVIRYNNFIPNDFGIYTYLLCQAVVPDYFICCLPYELAESSFVKILNEDFKIRLGTEIQMIHASNMVLDSITMMQSKNVETFYVDFDKLLDFIKNINNNSEIPIVNVIDNRSALETLLFDLLIDEENEAVDHG